MTTRQAPPTAVANLADLEEELGGTLGRYRLLAKLGQGGMGTIHVALSSGMGAFKKLVVLKELRLELTKNEKFVEMFLAEARVAAKLNHPNVIQTLEAGIDGERYFLSMEFLDGQPFSKVLRRFQEDRRFPLALGLRVLTEALAGLHYAHELCEYDGTPLEIVHRDVSPQNVFVTYDGQVKVLDFGIAKAAGAGEDVSTHPGVFKGKFGYAAPEQIMGQPSDRRADIFAAGVILWELIAGRRFAPGPPTRAAVEKRLAGAEPRIVEVVPGVDPRLADICDRAMAVNPEGRFATAEEVRSALQAFLSAGNDATDSRALGFAVRELFAHDRVLMHRLIDAGLKEDERNHSMVRALLPDAPEPTHEDPTTVADLSALIQSIRAEKMSDDDADALPAFRRSGRGYLVAVAGVIGVGIASLVFFANRSDTGPVTPAPAPRAVTPAAMAMAAAREPAPVPGRAEPRQDQHAPPATTARETALPARTLERARTDVAGPSTKEQGHKLAASSQSKTSRASAESKPRATSATRSPGSSDGEPAEGADMRRLRARANRKLDKEDPFQ